MTSRRSLPVDHKIVPLLAATTTNGGVSSRAISCKHGIKLWVIVDLKQAVGNATAISLKQCTNIAAGTNKAAPSVPIWANEDAAATDTLVKQAAWAAAYTVAADIKSKQIVFEVDPSLLDSANGYDCVYVSSADSTQATNFMNVTVIAQPRYEQSNPPSMVLD